MLQTSGECGKAGSLCIWESASTVPCPDPGELACLGQLYVFRVWQALPARRRLFGINASTYNAVPIWIYQIAEVGHRFSEAT